MAAITLAPVGVSSPASRPVPRLTRRGRRLARSVVVLLAAVLLLAAYAGHGSSAAGSAAPAGAPALRTVVVQPGQTLWSFARAVAPAADVRETVMRLRELNNLSAAQATDLRPGQPLLVPAAG